MKNKICLISPYFGPLPKWFPYHLESISHNKKIDWLFFTDSPKPNNLPKNLIWIPFSIKDLNRLASKKTKLPIKITKPYKICDLRPAFGHIFSQYLSQYDYWGHTDPDIIYGDLIKFIPFEADIISSEPYFIAGPLSFYKNTKKVNSLYKKNPEHVKAFILPQNLDFDETGYLNRQFRGSKVPKKQRIYAMTQFISDNKKKLKLKTEFLPLTFSCSNPLKPIKLHFSKGKLINKKTGKEIPFFHIHELKSKPPIIEPCSSPSSFIITNSGIFNSRIPKLKSLMLDLSYLKRTGPKNLDIYLGELGCSIKDKSPQLYKSLKTLSSRFFHEKHPKPTENISNNSHL